MKIDEFIVDIFVEVEISKEEVDHLIICSKAHYDGVCRAQNEIGGMLYGMKTRLHYDLSPNAPKLITTRLRCKDIDLLLKITEMEQPLSLSANKPCMKLHPVLKKIYDDVEKVRKEHTEILNTKSCSTTSKNG